jgi:hypothetical protein
VKLIRRFPACAYLFVAWLSATACSSSGSRDEVARVRSPDGLVDAILVETNGGATTSFGYEVVLVPSKTPVRSPSFAAVASLYGAARSDSAYGANLHWVASDTLLIEFFESKQATVNDSTPVVAGKRIHVALKSGVLDARAPSGGMLWNRQGRPQ